MATREGELFKEKIEVSLDGRQIFCLFCGGAVIACLVFVLGVMVGRRVESRAHPERASAGAASDPLAALDQLAADSAHDGDLAFASALRGQGDATGPVDQQLAEIPAPAPEPKKEEAKEPKPEKKEAPKPEPKKEAPAPEPKKEEPKAVEVASDKARFTLQLSSFQSRAEADAFVADLSKTGYTPYVVAADVDGKGTWYRVRVGAYGSQDDALKAKTEFEKKQKIIAYVTRLKK